MPARCTSPSIASVARRRSEAESRIKEAQVGLFASRTSCHVFATKPLRALLE